MASAAALQPRGDASGPGPVRLLASWPGHIGDVAMYGSMAIFNASMGPTWLVKTHNGLYAVDETTNVTTFYTANQTTGELKLDPVTGQLAPGITAVGSSGVVHLEMNKNGTRMLGAGYGAGAVDVWAIADDGAMTLMKTIPTQDPPSPAQTTSHPHQAVLDPSGRFFLVNDLGTDTILVIDSQDDAFAVTNRVRVDPPTAGPRHGAFYVEEASGAAPQTVYYVVAGETASVLMLFEAHYAADNISLAQIQTISTYGQDFPPANHTSAAAGELLLVPRSAGDVLADVYVSNRLSGNKTDNVVHFELSQPSGGVASLSFKQCIDSLGLAPRSMALDAAATTLFVANTQGSDSDMGLVAFPRDPTTGALDTTSLAIASTSAFLPFGAPGPSFVLPYQ